MTDLQFFQWHRDGPVATITFDRPEKRNPLNVDVMVELESLVCRARDHDDVRIMVLTGAGPVFCAGAEMPRRADGDDTPPQLRGEQAARVPRMIGRIVDTMVHMDVISIAAVNGHAVGGGWSLVTGFDHVIAVEEAQFWLPEVELGTPFRGLSNLSLTQRLGPALAREAMILCRRFTADELADYRVINRVCPADQLMVETQRAADAYLAMPWRAVLNTRRDINAAVYGPQHY